MDLSPEKMFLVGLVALVVLGPERLSQAARTAGKMVAEARRLSAGAHDEVSKALTGPRDLLERSAHPLNLSSPEAALRAARSSFQTTMEEIVRGTGATALSEHTPIGASGADMPPEEPTA